MKKPSGKKELLFESIIKLIKNGSALSSVTVAEIACAAGVGKGTVYEYFQSKEDLISSAIIYMLERELDEYEQAVEAGDTFCDKIHLVFKKIKVNFENKSSVVHLLMQNIRFSDVSEYIEKEKYFMTCKECVNKIIDKVILAGIQESIISKENDLEYQRTVMLGAAFMFIYSVCDRLDHQQSEKNVIKMIKTALA